MEGGGGLFKLKRPKFLNRDNRSLPPQYELVNEDSEDAFSSVDLKALEVFDPEDGFDGKRKEPGERSSSVPELRQIPRLVSATVPQMIQQPGGSTEKSTKDPLGLDPVSLPPRPIIDIIFIHGLGGSSYRSWSWERDRRNFWPQWLSLEPEFSNARIYTFGYTAGIGGSSNAMNILDFAKDLLFKLKFPNTQGPSIGSLPIILVTHSMGGLIAKKAYIAGKNDKEHTDTISQIKAMIFLSTPHRGGNGAERLSQILQIFNISKDYVKELATNSTMLQSINDDFSKICQELKLFSFYETLKTFNGTGRSCIVDKDSGILNLPNETSSPMVADHHDICKFQNREDSRYRDIRNVLSSLISPFMDDTLQPPIFDTSAEIKDLGISLSINENEIADDSERFKTKVKEGTCSWVSERKWFVNWLQNDEDEPHILWISGPPASGKSVLASYIAENIRMRWGDVFCQYHNFDFSDKSKRSASYLFRSLAYQIARVSSPFRARLLQMSHQLGAPISSLSATMLWDKIFCSVLFDMTLGKTMYWIIDGLDETEPGAISLIFNCLKSINRCMRLKILLVSRPATDIVMRMKQLPFKCTEYEISTLDIHSDIRAFVEEAVKIMIPREAALRQRIVNKVLTKASGNFLWVVLVMKDLEETWHRQSNIDHTLNGFPSEMTSFYGRMMRKIEVQPESTRKMATTFLTWATYSFRPLQMTELKTALQAEFPDLISLEDTINYICGDFVQVRSSKLSLIHETAKYFLVNSNANALVSLNSMRSHEYLAKVCLQYLSSSKERQWRQILNIAEIRRSKDPLLCSSVTFHGTESFLPYAAKFWAYHLSLASPDSQELRETLSTFFDNDALTWINALALLGELQSLMKAAQYLKSFTKKREKMLSETVPRGFLGDNVEFLKLWTIDIIKIIGRFGSNLVEHPSSIYKLIPPFCPANSILRKTFGQSYGSFSVTGVSFPEWDDCHARVSVGTDEIGTKVLATVEVFAALVPQAQSLVVWHAETCEELRRMHHGEYVTGVAVNRSGDLVSTSGRNTIKIWELGNGRMIASFEKHSDDRVLALGFGSTDDHISVGYQDHLIVCQNWRTGELIHAFRASLKGDQNVHNGLRCISFSPDGTQVAVGSRKSPVELWDLSTESRTHRCIREDEISHSESDVFQQPEVIQWHPDSGDLYIIYHNATLTKWNPVYGEQSEHEIGAKGMVISPCGNYLLTSDHDGSVRVFTVPGRSRAHAPELSPIYHLEYHEYVHDLAFSPDGRRFYDLRGSICSVWEPDALIPAEKPDAEEDRSSSSGSLWTVETIKSSAASHSRALITAIACAPRDLGFCCGRDDGTITIHDMETGKRIRNLPGHASEMAIIGLTWSSSGNLIASGDDSGHLLVRKVQMPKSGSSKLTVYKPSDFRIRDDGINQLLFSSNDKYLLVSTHSADRIWDVAAKKICHERFHPFKRHIKWIEHPKDPSRLVSIDTGEVHIFDWIEFADLTKKEGLRFAHPIRDGEAGKRKFSNPASPAQAQASSEQSHGDKALDVVSCVTQTKDKSSVIFETLPSGGHDRDRNKRRRIELIRTADIDPAIFEQLVVLEGSVQELAREVSKLVGSYQNQVVFFNHQHWLCTWEIGTSAKSYKRHLFLPRDWINSETLSLTTLNDHGTLMCPKNGEVAIIKNGIRF